MEQQAVAKYQVTNPFQRRWVMYDVKGRARLINAGAKIAITMTEGQAQFAHQRALAGVGPTIELLEEEETVEQVEARPIQRRRPKNTR